MFNNGYSSNNFNTTSNNFRNGNVAGINKSPASIGGISNNPGKISGVNKTPMQVNPFEKIHRDNSGPAKQVMNSQGQNLIHNEFRGIK